MQQTFLTNRNTVIFYAILSLIVVPFGVINLYRALTDSGSYSIGFRAIIAPILPLLTYFTCRNGLLVVQPDGVRMRRDTYGFVEHDFVFGQKHVALKDRPLTSLWKAAYCILSIKTKKGVEVAEIPLEMSSASRTDLQTAIAARMSRDT